MYTRQFCLALMSVDTKMPRVQALKARLDECSLEQCKAVARYISMKTLMVVARLRDISTALQVRHFLDSIT